MDITYPSETLARPTLCYGNEAWATRKQDINRITAWEMKFTWRTAGCTEWDHERSENTLDKLKIKSEIGYILNYQRKWQEHMNRMNTGRIPKQILCYKLRERLIRHPMKRWEDNTRL